MNFATLENCTVCYVNESPPRTPNRRSQGRRSEGINQLSRVELSVNEEAFTEEHLENASRLVRHLDSMCVHPYIDTHCHLDLIFDRLKYKGSWSDFKDKCKILIPAKYSGCIQVFCDPRSFSMNDWVVSLLRDSSDVWFTFGVHPKKASRWDHTIHNKLTYMLDSLKDKVVAVGEVGLDYSQRFYENCEQQAQVLREHVQIAVDRKLPLVLHCREADFKACTKNAHEDLINILKEKCSPNQKLHVHCFTGAWKYAQQWLETFPNAYIGITPLVSWHGKRSDFVKEVAEKIPLNRLLLETDAPYFSHDMIPNNELTLSQPWLALTVAKELSYIREIPLSVVLTSCLENTKALYGIPL